jgi:hypothetical protein
MLAGEGGTAGKCPNTLKRYSSNVFSLEIIEITA